MDNESGNGGSQSIGRVGTLTLLRIAAVAVAVVLGGQVQAAVPDSYDNLQRVKAKRIDAAFLLTGARFGGYSKIMIDPTDAAFARNWQRDYNNSQRNLGGRVSDDQAVKLLDDVRIGWQAAFVREFGKAGYTIVTSPVPTCYGSAPRSSISASSRRT